MNKLPIPENRSFFHDEMFKVHYHAEIEYDKDPGKVVYAEEDVLALLRIVRDKTLEWAAENTHVKSIYVEDEWGMNRTLVSKVDKKSILAGKTHKDLEI